MKLNRWKFAKLKYNNTPTCIDGWRFDSKAEAARYKQLCLMKMAGEIDHFDIHPVFRLTPEIKYIADFMVYYKNGEIEVEDVKGIETPEFKLKCKLFDREHPFAPLKIIRGKRGRK